MASPIIGGRSYGRSSNHQFGSSSQEPLSPALSPAPVANSEPSVHMEDSYVVRTDLPMLHHSRNNGSKWFKHNTEVSTAIRKIIQGCFKGPWYSWKKVPPYYKRTWFSMFKKKFNWDASINYSVEREFNKTAAYRLKGMVSVVKKGGVKPDWILSDYWTTMQAYWATAKAKKTSASARASRLSDRNGLGPHRHRAGSCSYAKVQDVLEANNEDSSFIAVMKKHHQRPDGTYVDERARLVAETYEKHVEERLGQLESSGQDNVTLENLDQSEKNEIYVKAAECLSRDVSLDLEHYTCVMRTAAFSRRSSIMSRWSINNSSFSSTLSGHILRRWDGTSISAGITPLIPYEREMGFLGLPYGALFGMPRARRSVPRSI
ncbi:uncharacterized protein LOC130511222 [Raphanus sativus]|uniref:Uncharacterized protein LOC130511222 n=1 Tax=Raphanus sativus TaxID=3726 RepID=A0A9W3DKY6_RAPSA|nr:uncharacterized protein LOC130511222 [Raphanus sativus]